MRSPPGNNSRVRQNYAGQLDFEWSSGVAGVSWVPSVSGSTRMDTRGGPVGKKSRRPTRANHARSPRSRDSLRVSLVTYPHSTGEIRGTLARDVELAKAAVLYADHVDLVSMSASVLSEFASMR